MTKPKYTRKKKTTNKKQVEAIAKQVVTRQLKKEVELKYFDSAEWRNIVPFYLAGNKFSCVGFSSTNNTQPDGGAYQYPTGHNIYQLQCLNPFKSNSIDPEKRNYAIEGRECNPLSALTHFVLSRDPAVNQQVLTLPITQNQENKQPPFNQVTPLDVAMNCPVICRMVRVVPNLASGINTEPDPAEDLFLNRYGDPQGVNGTEIDEVDVMNWRINKRRYTVVTDTKFKLNNPYSISWTASSQSDVAVSQVSELKTHFMANVTPNGDYCQRTFKCYDQLAQRKGGKVFYEDPNAAQVTNATSGHRRTYTLFHFMYQGADSVTGTAWNKKAPIDLYIDTNTLSRFTDM